MNTLVTLTAYNEAKNIADIINKIHELGYSCLVVDDGSTDGTAKIAESLNAIVVKHSLNLGQGYAVITSFKAALQQDCDIIIEMDADGQHDPNEIPIFTRKMIETDADIVVGSRILGSNYDGAPFFRKTFLPHFSWFINYLTKFDMTDAMCGFRAFKRDSLYEIAPVLDNMLEPQYIAAEMFIRFAKAGLRVEEVPIRLNDRSSGVSYKGLIRYGTGVLRAIARTYADKAYHTQRRL